MYIFFNVSFAWLKLAKCGLSVITYYSIFIIFMWMFSFSSFNLITWGGF